MAEKTKRQKLVESYITAANEEVPFQNKRIKRITETILHNQLDEFETASGKTADMVADQIMNEDGAATNIADADVAKFGEIYLPIAAKVIPSLVINNMVGVQPMTQPNGFVYAMRASYSTSPYASTAVTRGVKYSNSQILNLANGVGTMTDITAGTSYLTASAKVSGTIDTLAYGLVIYKEESLVLVKTYPGTSAAAHAGASGTDLFANFLAADVVDANDTALQAYAVAQFTVSAIYKNELAQAAGIFKNYSGSVSTDAGMYAQDAGETTIRVERTSVEAKTRQLFAEYPIEAEQDLRAIHKRDLRAELSEITAGEIVNEISKEFIEDINTAAAVGGSSTFDMESADGRWEIEKFRNMYTRITKNANDIAMDTRLGPGNYIITSSNVTTALTQLDGFEAAPVQGGGMGGMSRIGGDWYVGRIAGMYDVYRDMFATSDYVTVGRKGANEWDAGLFFLPYVPLQFIAGQTQENLQPKMKFMTRYGKVTNVLNATENVADPRYYRSISVDNLFQTF